MSVSQERKAVQWAKLKDWPYEISDTGLVKSRRTGLIRKRSFVRLDGYDAIVLLNQGKRRTFCIHRLVCLAFHGDPPSEKHQAAHNNGQKQDNRAVNLRWATPAENGADNRIFGTHRGDKNGNSKLSADDVRKIRLLCERGVPQKHIAECFGIQQPYVSGLKRRIKWAHIP